jgi:hypothetical protein
MLPLLLIQGSEWGLAVGFQKRTMMAQSIGSGGTVFD